MKVTVLLRNDHEGLNGLFEKFKKLASDRNTEARTDLFSEIRRELQIHFQMEREIFYPALRATPSARAAALVTSAEQEHEAIEKLLQELGANAADKNFDTKMAQMIGLMTRHVQIEEEEMFDEARKNLPEYRLEELGLEMEDRRKILLTLAA